MAWFFDTLKARFKIKLPVYLSKSNAIDHLSMVMFENDNSIYLSMQNYTEVVLTKLGINVDKTTRKLRAPMSAPITDMTPCLPKEAKQFTAICVIIKWLPATGRPELHMYHSRISQCMATLHGARRAQGGAQDHQVPRAEQGPLPSSAMGC